MHYRVILNHDNYYSGNYKKFQTATEADSSGYGDVTVPALPPYGDMQMAMSCKWESDTWVYDSEKYAALVAAEEEAKKAAEEAAKIPTNKELMQAISDTMDAVLMMGEEFQKKIEPLTKLSELLK